MPKEVTDGQSRPEPARLPACPCCMECSSSSPLAGCCRALICWCSVPLVSFSSFRLPYEGLPVVPLPSDSVPDCSGTGMRTSRIPCV
jgi:hypothetical protein